MPVGKTFGLLLLNQHALHVRACAGLQTQEVHAGMCRGFEAVGVRIGQAASVRVVPTPGLHTARYLKHVIC